MDVAQMGCRARKKSRKRHFPKLSLRGIGKIFFSAKVRNFKLSKMPELLNFIFLER